MATSHESAIKFLGSTEKRMPELDGIRGMAILLVLIYHYIICQAPISVPVWFAYPLAVLIHSWSGVDLFFVLSGFLLGGILLDHKKSTNFFQVFYIRRACRILPLYFLWLSIWVAATSVMPFLVKEAPFNFLFNHKINFVYYYTFTQNIVMSIIKDYGGNWLGVSWSLAVEEQFYLILPLLIYLFSLRHLRYLFFLAVLIALFLRTALVVYQPYPAFPCHVLLPCRADALFLGALCALALRDESIKRFISLHILMFYVFAGLLFVYLGNMIIQGVTVFTEGMSSYGYSVLAVFYACILLIAVTEKQGLISSIVRLPWLRELGIMAYGVYMFHEGILGLAFAIFRHNVPAIKCKGDIGITLLAFITTIVIAKISWVYLEKPIISFGHRWAYNKKVEK